MTQPKFCSQKEEDTKRFTMGKKKKEEKSTRACKVECKVVYRCSKVFSISIKLTGIPSTYLPSSHTFTN